MWCTFIIYADCKDARFMFLDILLIPLVLLAVVILIAILKTLFASKKETVLHSYDAAGTLLSPAELSFFKVLELAVGDNAYIVVKVRVADLLMPQKGMTRSNWQKAFNSISSKHIDFVICDKTNFKPLCAIELNDKSHRRKSRTVRDEFISKAFASARVPLEFIIARRAYSAECIREQLEPYLGAALKSKRPVPAEHSSPSVLTKNASAATPSPLV